MESRWVLTSHLTEQETKLTLAANSGKGLESKLLIQGGVLDFQQAPGLQLPLSFLSSTLRGLPKGMETYGLSPYYLALASNRHTVRLWS